LATLSVVALGWGVFWFMRFFSPEQVAGEWSAPTAEELALATDILGRSVHPQQRLPVREVLLGELGSVRPDPPVTVRVRGRVAARSRGPGFALVWLEDGRARVPVVVPGDGRVAAGAIVVEGQYIGAGLFADRVIPADPVEVLTRGWGGLVAVAGASWGLALLVHAAASGTVARLSSRGRPW
jgi:hypothetical protein